jgi:sulfonate transport system ATP-binding protein
MLLRDGKIAVDRPVELTRPRRHADPAFNRMRAELLADLGVHGAD